jgi:hypothetical protein
LGRLARTALVLFFVWLAARHWNPYYGFTRFLQCDASAHAVMLPSLREARIFVHPDPGSYDGFFYAQLATSPGLQDSALKTAIDDLGYRSRRILLSATAWVLARGDPISAARVYAWLNVVGWLVLAAVLWRVFPVSDGRGILAWAGVMFSTGVLFSVRLALPDLTALLLIAAAAIQREQGRRWWAAVLIGLAGLTRETALLGVVVLLPTQRISRRELLVTAGTMLLAVLPLLLWLVHVWLSVGSSGAGLNNFAWPLQGFIKKAGDLWHAWQFEANRAAVITTVLAFASLPVQFIYLALRPAIRDPFWRTGAAFGVLMLCLGPAVWGDDLPGAAFRVLLPLTLAFNVTAVRRRAAWIILLLGNLSVGGGLLTLSIVSRDAHEVASGRFHGGTYVMHSGATWFPAEGRPNRTWAWCPQDGSVTLETCPRTQAAIRVGLAFRGFTPRDLEVKQAGRTLWRGFATDKTEWIEVTALPDAEGKYELTFHSDTAPGRENPQAGGRPLSFALSGVKVE